MPAPSEATHTSAQFRFGRREAASQVSGSLSPSREVEGSIVIDLLQVTDIGTSGSPVLSGEVGRLRAYNNGRRYPRDSLLRRSRHDQCHTHDDQGRYVA